MPTPTRRPSPLAARLEVVRARVQQLPRDELERRFLSVLEWIAAPDEDTNGGDLVEFLGDLLRDLI